MAEPGSNPVRPSGSTQVGAVIGSPVRHSRSPQLANAAFVAGGFDWVMVALEVAPGRSSEAVAAVRTLGLGGLMVTMPHKAEIIGALDRITDDAAALGAVNSVAWEGEELVGDNTDGAGLIASLTSQGVPIAGRSAVVVGAGGAARAVIRSLAQAGAQQVTVVNRSAERAEQAASMAGPVGVVGAEDGIVDADLVINATPVGMGSSPLASAPVPFPVELISEGQTVIDLVYQPLTTPLLRRAAAQGAQAVDGLGMLVHQAALTLTRWTGVPPDVEVMEGAARA